VDVASLTFGRTGSEQSLAFCGSHGEDVNGDLRRDLVCHFDTRSTGLGTGDTEGLLQGRTVTGDTVAGADSVQVVR
jgi:hypothetical protein